MLPNYQKTQVSIRTFSIGSLQKYTCTDIDLDDIKSLRIFSEMFNLSWDFFHDLELFGKRNGGQYKSVCTKCFKAFFIKTAKQYALPESTISFFHNYFKSELGHDGYYLDMETIYKI